jgi:hypothetical protein
VLSLGSGGGAGCYLPSLIETWPPIFSIGSGFLYKVVFESCTVIFFLVGPPRHHGINFFYTRFGPTLGSTWHGPYSDKAHPALKKKSYRTLKDVVK